MGHGVLGLAQYGDHIAKPWYLGRAYGQVRERRRGRSNCGDRDANVRNVVALKLYDGSLWQGGQLL